MTIDWESAPEGATHYVPESNAYHACWYKDDFKQSCLVVPKPHNAGGWTASPYRPNISARAIPRPTYPAIPAEQDIEVIE